VSKGTQHRWRCYVCNVESEFGGEEAIASHVVTRSHYLCMAEAMRGEADGHRLAITKSEEAAARFLRLAEEATS
jgi:hypothetical protein